jgi:hypothetical protein
MVLPASFYRPTQGETMAAIVELSRLDFVGLDRNSDSKCLPLVDGVGMEEWWDVGMGMWACGNV